VLAETHLTAAWSAEPLVLAAAAVTAISFARAFLRLRRRGRADHASWNRALLFTCGLALATLPLVSPLYAACDNDLLSAHMLQHVLIGDAAPALLLVAVRGPLLAFMIPVAVVRFANKNGAMQAMLGLFATPVAAFAAWAGAIAFWHVPAVYDAALRRPWLHDLEHTTFVVVGLLVWLLLIDPAGRGHLSIKGRAALAGCLFLAGQALCSVLFLASAPLYPAYVGTGHGLLGLTPLADQQYAGLVMMAEQFLTLGTCVVLLGRSLLHPARRPPRLAY
jgi:putative membrane protein